MPPWVFGEEHENLHHGLLNLDTPSRGGGGGGGGAAAAAAAAAVAAAAAAAGLQLYLLRDAGS